MGTSTRLEGRLATAMGSINGAWCHERRGDSEYVSAKVLPAFQDIAGRLDSSAEDPKKDAERILRRTRRLHQLMVDTLDRYVKTTAPATSPPPLICYTRDVLELALRSLGIKKGEEGERKEEFDLIHDILDRMYALHGRLLGQVLQRHLPPDCSSIQSAYDLGSRDGIVASFLRKNKLNVIATDVSPKRNPYYKDYRDDDLVFYFDAMRFSGLPEDIDSLSEEARESIEKARQPLEIPDESADLLMASNLLHKFSRQDQVKGLKNSRNALKDGGRILVVTPYVENPSAHLVACCTDKGAHSTRGSIRTIDDWTSAFLSAGWDFNMDSLTIHPHTNETSAIDGYPHVVIEAEKNSENPRIDNRERDASIENKGS